MDNPWLRQIEPSCGLEEAIVFMTGYCTEENCEPYHHQHWIKNLREADWRGAVYYLWWDSLGLNPCGLKPIEKVHSKINNLDVTSFVGKSHDLEKYLNVLPKLAQQRAIEF
jgi:hypothetical protein